MKTDNGMIRFIAIFYTTLLLGVILFCIFNPFDNRCVKGNCRNGFGVYIHNSGITYEGEWKRGLKSGRGKLIYPQLYVYDGEWKNGRRDGQGSIVYKKEAHYIDMYVGAWKNGHIHGEGEITYQNGGWYIGGLKNGKYDGKGKIIAPDGIIIEGQWRNGKRYGQDVTITYPDGRKTKSSWEKIRFSNKRYDE